jgi:hypothetical protein
MDAVMFRKVVRIGTAGAAVVWLALSGAAGCSQNRDGAAAAGGVRAEVLQDPWMAGERWGMPPEEVKSALGMDPALQSDTSDYYAAELDGRAALAQYVFGKETGTRGLARKLFYLATPKRPTFLPPMSIPEGQEAFRSVKARLDGRYGSASVVTQAMAVSKKLESQSRVIGDRVAAAEKEERALERELETRRKELQRQYAGHKNRNAMVAEGLVELEHPLRDAKRKVVSLKDQQRQIRMAIREECAALPENKRPFHWESVWEAPDGTVALYLTVNERGTFLTVSFAEPD